jgi:beta-glucanase (GH16 family)
VSPTANITYSISCSGAGGTSATQSVTVTVNGGTPPPPPPTGTVLSIFTTQTPGIPSKSDGATTNYELGAKFQSTAAGTITGIRFYKSSSESGTHTGRMWSAAGTQLASVVFSGETASGWQTATLSTPIAISANTTYVVTVNTGNSYYVKTDAGLDTSVINGSLSTIVGNNGVFGNVGVYPTSSNLNSNYFRDVVFVVGGTVPPPPPPSTKFVVGDRIQVSSGPLNVRATANTTGTSLGTQATGALGSVIGGPVAQGGYSWWNINFDTGVDGWSAEDFLTKYTAPSAPTLSISASPTSITSGQSSTITWSSTNATSCTASNGWTGTKAVSSSQVVTPTVTTTYTLTCTSAGGSTATQSTTVTVTATTPPPTSGCPATKRTVTATDVANNTNSGYPAGTQLYVPDGPDPWGGCFPGPKTTGIPAGTQLTAYTGPAIIDVPGTVIDGKIINVQLNIRAANVTIKNSKYIAGSLYVDSGSLMFTDSEADFTSNIISDGIKGSNLTVLHSNLYGGRREFYCNSNCTLQDSYLHDQLADPTGAAHESAARVEQYTTLKHNTLNCNAPLIPPDAGCSANQTGYPDFVPIHHNTLDKNLYMATTGGFCSYLGASAGKPYSSDPTNASYVVSTNNVFQRGISANDRPTISLTDKRRYTCGVYGVVTDYDVTKPGVTICGNMWDDGLLFKDDADYPFWPLPNTCGTTTPPPTTPPPASTKFSINDRVQVTNATLNVRATPDTAGTLLGQQTTGALGTVVGGPTAQGGYSWWNINYDTGVDGWSVEDYLAKYTAPPPPATTTAPDLVVTSVTALPANPTVGQAVTFSAVVKNQGTAATPAGTILGVLFYVDDGTATWSGNYSTSLAPGASVTLTATGGNTASTWTAVSGTHSVSATADDVNRIVESNENNNSLSTTVTVGSGSTTPPPTGVTQPPAPVSTGKLWQLNFADEFSGTALDTTKFSPCFDWNYGGCTESFNHGRERYLPSQVQVSGGTAKLIAEPLSPPYASTGCYNGSCTYKAGFIGTDRPRADNGSDYLYKFTYGYVESRMKFPATQGFFTAFWMLPADPTYSYKTEIDIAEILGDDPQSVFMTYHYNNRSTSFSADGGLRNNGACAVKDYSADWITLGLDWEPTYIAWYINGLKCGQFNGDATTIESGPMQLLLHMMVGNDWQRSWNKDLLDPTLTRQLEVDYVRVWQQVPNGTTPPPPLAAPTVTLSANPNAITAGQSSTLMWSSTNATSCTGTGFTASGISGSAIVSPTATTNYSVTCSGTGGTSAPQSATVTVTAPITPASTKFSLNDRVQVSSGPLNVRSTANTTGTQLGTQATGALGTVIGGPVAQGGYSWWNINYDSGVDGWSVEDYLTKYTAPPPPAAPTVTISVSPSSITAGQSTTITWSSTNATSCTASNGWTGTKATSGTQNVSPTANITYTLLCQGTGGSATQSTTVTVTAPPPPASTKFSLNDRVQVINGPLNVRSTANTTGTQLGTQATGALGTVVGGPTAQGGLNWWQINYDSGADGWSVETYLTKYTAPPPAAPTVTLSASPTSITSGLSSKLTWSSTNATSCTGTGFTASGISGQATVSPTTNTTYSIVTCTGAGGSVQMLRRAVTVTAPVPTGSPDLVSSPQSTASPANPTTGQVS